MPTVKRTNLVVANADAEIDRAFDLAKEFVGVVASKYGQEFEMADALNGLHIAYFSLVKSNPELADAAIAQTNSQLEQLSRIKSPRSTH